jgi:hypothetical protein
VLALVSAAVHGLPLAVLLGVVGVFAAAVASAGRCRIGPCGCAARYALAVAATYLLAYVAEPR